MTLERLKEILDQHFSAPFLDEGLVRAEFIASPGEKTLQVNIGRRDVWINEEGEITASGTFLEEVKA